MHNQYCTFEYSFYNFYMIDVSLLRSTARRERQGATGSRPNANADSAATYYLPEDAVWRRQQNVGSVADECSQASHRSFLACRDGPADCTQLYCLYLLPIDPPIGTVLVSAAICTPPFGIPCPFLAS